MELFVDLGGDIRCIYSEDVDLTELGSAKIQRASHVEPTDDGSWTADMAPMGGPVLGPFQLRSEALKAEVEWLGDCWMHVCKQVRHTNGTVVLCSVCCDCIAVLYASCVFLLEFATQENCSCGDALQGVT